jgi:hypothetical protein
MSSLTGIDDLAFVEVDERDFCHLVLECEMVVVSGKKRGGIPHAFIGAFARVHVALL